MPEVEVTPDGWLVPSHYWHYFRFITSHEPPRPGAVWFQLRVDAVHWKPIAFWVVGVGLIAAAVATGMSPIAFAGATVLSAYLAMLWMTSRTLRDRPVAVAVIKPVPPQLPVSRGLFGEAVMAGGRMVPVGIPPAIAQAVMATGANSEVLFLYTSQATRCLVLAARPSVGSGKRPPLRVLPAPALLADAPNVPWDAAARQVLAAMTVEAGGADYLGTCHLLLAAARHCPEATGVDYVEARAAVGGPAASSECAAAGERWPTPRLRQTVVTGQL